MTETVLADIRTEETPDPVPMIDESGSELAVTDAYDEYRLGRGSGDYPYVLYLLAEPIEGPSAIHPVYIGETGQMATRFMNHFRKVRDALPIAD